MREASGLGLHLSPPLLAGSALVQVGSALGHWPQHQPLGLTGLPDLRLGHPDDGMGQLIVEQLHENYEYQDTPWGHHFVPVSNEVMQAPIRGVHRGQDKGKAVCCDFRCSREIDLPFHNSCRTYFEFSYWKEGS